MIQTDDPHFRRLTEAVDNSFRLQKVDRESHQTLTNYLMDDLYPVTNGQAPETSLPLLSLAYRAMCRYMISKAPRMLVQTDDPQRKAWAENAEIAGNRRIVRCRSDQALREVVGQSMVSFGTLFFAPQYVGTPRGMRLDLAVDPIDRADYVFDQDSRTLEAPDFEGHRIRMKIADIRDYPDFDPAGRMAVEPSIPSVGDETTNFKEESGRRTGLYDYAEIWCVYDRPRNMLVYYPRHQPDILLLEMPWYGPVHGPYRKLYYEKIAGNAVPISPLQHLFKKHRAFNVLDLKTIHQQQVAKGLLAYTNAGKEEAERIVNAIDNQSVLQETGATRYLHIGGASPDTVAMAEKQRRDFAYASGGIIDQFQQQADTLGQERLLRGAANEMLEDMAGWAYWFVRGFCEDVFWFDIRDPNPEPQRLRKRIAGSTLTYEVPWTIEHRRMVEELEFDVDVEPYSYRERSPESRLADLMGAVQFYGQVADQAMAQGITLDVEAVFRTIGRYRNLPELYEWFVMNQSPERLQQLLGHRSTGGQPNNGTPRRYVRESRSDGSGAEQEIMRMFGRGAPKEVEVA